MAQSKRVQFSYVMEGLPAPPREVFPLLCPVREGDWIPGWSAEVLWSRSGVAEAGAVFTTPGTLGAPWVWHIVDRDPASGRIRFSVTAPESHLLELTLDLQAAGAGSRLAWTYTLLALTPGGEAFMESYAGAFQGKMDLLDRRLRHWLRTGTRLSEGTA